MAVAVIVAVALLLFLLSLQQVPLAHALSRSGNDNGCRRRRSRWWGGIGDGASPPPPPPPPPPSLERRRLFEESMAKAVGALAVPSSASAAVAPGGGDSGGGLASRLSLRDPSQLRNRLFNNVPPSAQVYPDWLAVGDWRVACSFGGFAFPSAKIPKERLLQNAGVPGFQKCSVAATPDVGVAATPVSYDWTVDPITKTEDRRRNLKRCVDAFLGYDAVSDVVYDEKRNPNRISIDFVDYKTVNAERIELFCNARESEEIVVDDGGTDSAASRTFVCSEYVRQVTFGTGETYGVPRQAVTNYAHFWTYRKGGNGGLNGSDGDSNQGGGGDAAVVRGNLLTAGYLDAQDPMFFDEPTLPVVVYSHDLTLTKK